MSNNKELMRIIIKIGTSSLTHKSGRPSLRQIEEILDVICDIKKMGHEVVIVSSGAIGAGVGKLNLAKRPREPERKRALAAIGQSSLMAVYEDYCRVYGISAAQVLLTKTALADAATLNEIINTFNVMFEYGVLPVVNENDVTAIHDKKTDDLFGDNDTLSAYVAASLKADLLVILSDIDGLYDKNPNESAEAQLIETVTKITPIIRKAAGGAGSKVGSGGMATKLNAAEIAAQAGVEMIITNAARPETLYDIIAGKRGAGIGTTFVPD